MLSIALPFQFKTASTRIKREAWEEYNKVCAEKGITPFTDLKKYIESELKHESRPELGKNGESNREKPKEILGETAPESGTNKESWFW